MLTESAVAETDLHRPFAASPRSRKPRDLRIRGPVGLP